MKYLACTTAISLAALFPVAAGAATYMVPAGDSVTASASGTYDVVEVEGSLTVPSGVTLVGDTNHLGRSAAATVVVKSGGTFGFTDQKQTPNAIYIGEKGGKENLGRHPSDAMRF